MLPSQRDDEALRLARVGEVGRSRAWLVFVVALTACEISPDQVKFAPPSGPVPESAESDQELRKNRDEASLEGKAKRD